MSHLKDKGHQRQGAPKPYEKKKNVASRVKEWLAPSSWWNYLGYGEDPNGKSLTPEDRPMVHPEDPAGRSQSMLMSTRNGRSGGENLLGADRSNLSLFQNDGLIPQFATPATKLVAGPSRQLLECTSSVVSGPRTGMEGDEEDSRESEESWVAEDDSDVSNRGNPACGVNVGRQLSPITREERQPARLGDIDSRPSHSHPRGGTRLAPVGSSLPSSSAIVEPVHVVEQIRNPSYKVLSKAAEGTPSPGSIFSNRLMTSSTSVLSHKLFSTRPITTSTPQVSPLQDKDVEMTDTSTVRHHPRIMEPPHTGETLSQDHRPRPLSDTPRPTLSRPHTSTPGPAFSIAAFTTPSRLYTDISLSRSPFQSPFYSGRTSYGGMAAGQRLRVKRPRTDPSPPNVPLIRHTVRARPAGGRDQQSVSSHTAKKILETLECLSSPLSDARKLPLRGEPYDSSTMQRPAKRRRSNHPSSSILSPPPVTPLLTPSHAQVSNIHAPVIVPNEKSVLTRNDSKAEGSKFFSFHQVRTRESSTELPPTTSGSTSASSLLPREVPHPQGLVQLQPRGGATTNREIPLPQLPTSGLQFGILSSKSQASTLGSLTFTAPSLRQASPPVPSSQQTLPGGGRGSETEPPPPAAKFSPVFHASLSQGGGKMRSHRSPRHVSRKDSSSEVNPMELPPAVPLASNVPSFLFTAQLQAAQSSPTTTAQPLSVPMATSSSSSSFSFATPKLLGTDSTTSSAGQQSGPLPFSFSAPKNCKETTTKLQPSSVPLPSLAPTSLPPPSLPPLRPSLTKPKLPQANPLPPLKSVSVEQILKQPEFQLGGKKEKVAPCEVIDLTDEEEEMQGVAKVPLPPLKPLPQFAAPQGSWSCDTCMVNNKPSDNSCVACGTARPSTQRKEDSKKNSTSSTGFKLPTSKVDVALSSSSSASEKPLDSKQPPTSEGVSLLKQFAPPAGSWSCEVCMVVNKAEDSACVSCTTPRPGSKKTETKLTPGSSGGFKIDSSKGLKLGEGITPLKPLSQFAPPTNSWSCDTCMVTNKEDATSCVACGTAKPGADSGTKAEGLEGGSGGVAVQFGAQGGIKLSLGGGLSLGTLASASTSGGIKLGTTLGQKEGATISQSEVVPIKLGSGGLKLGNLPLATPSEKKSDPPNPTESQQLSQPTSGGGIQLAPALVSTSSKESSLPSSGGITLGAPLPMPTATGGVTGGLKLGTPLQFNAPMVSNPASELTTTLSSQPPSFSFSSSSSSFAFKSGTTQAGASSSTTDNPLSQIKFGVPTQVTTATTSAPAMPQFSFTSAPPTSTTAQTNLPMFNFSAGTQQQAKETNSNTMFAFSATKDLGKPGDTSKPSFSISGNSSVGGSLGVLGGAKLEQMPGGFNFGAQPGITPSLGGGEQQKTQPPQQGLALGSSETFVFGGPLVSSQQQTQPPPQNLFAAMGDQPPTKPITFNFHSAQATTAGMTQSSNSAPSLSFGSSQLAFGQSGNGGLSALTAPQGLGGNSGGALPKLQFGGNNPPLGGLFTAGTQDSKNSTGSPLGGMFAAGTQDSKNSSGPPLGGMFAAGTQDSKNSSGPPLGGMFTAGTQDSKNNSGPSASSTGFNFSTTGMNLNFGATAAAPTVAPMFSSGSSDSNNVEGRIIRKARRRKT